MGLCAPPIWYVARPPGREDEMRTLLGLLIAGLALLLGLKLLAVLVLPLLGLIALAIKLAVIAAVVYFLYALVRGKKREQQV